MENNIYTIELLQKHKKLISANIIHYKDDFIFQQEMDKFINMVCKDKEAFNFYSLNNHEALKEARMGNVQKAEMLMMRAKKCIDFDVLSIVEKDVYTLISLPIQAFLSYKKTNYMIAKQQTYETMLFDEKLEGYNPSISYHKIQQLHNMSRIEMKEKNIDNTVIIFNLLYRNLLLSEEVNYQEITFFYEDSTEALKKLRKLMLGQITNEYILFLDKLENKVEILDRTFHEVFENEAAVNNDLKSYLYWIILKKSAVDHQQLDADVIKNFINKSVDYTSTVPIDSLLNEIKTPARIDEALKY
ncbi:hypothetical protein C1637_18635 [Chryseobacterium lactis]|uniref:Uncharacterized protein n=1 Tax=Chryseobacterium lactis TaxID=1241981 RepID=A0A3G6RLN8_CHRLC|nr:hypothetical protein [Chryseobacterium lactis]AZA84799.1 hypothetical protein EG342_24145 [Chryseobacterium lactis]AZB05188.1 hypothetical protein EG341_15025 [Chryseobacterium lactis]PNW12170.1 hypothetical protein C1637_18635 [Chryseobacterium lactis]